MASRPTLAAVFLDLFRARDALASGELTGAAMEEIAWEIGYEHATYGLDPYTEGLARFEPLAAEYKIDLRTAFDAGFGAT